jgi:hypothetical protein
MIIIKNLNNKEKAYQAWLNPQMKDKWLVFDGVQVSFHDSYATIKEDRGERTICLVGELGSVFGEDAYLEWNELLRMDY